MVCRSSKWCQESNHFKQVPSRNSIWLVTQSIRVFAAYCYVLHQNLIKLYTAHNADIFSLAATRDQLISASGSAAIKIYSTRETDFPLVQTLEKTHKLGCHHLAISNNREIFASAGFCGEVIVWSTKNGKWTEENRVLGAAQSEPGIDVWNFLTVLQTVTMQAKYGQ